MAMTTVCADDSNKHGKSMLYERKIFMEEREHHRNMQEVVESLPKTMIHMLNSCDMSKMPFLCHIQ
eukprot:scaffold64366_cov28-Prasinocladus_malaysianus.AAC.1